LGKRSNAEGKMISRNDSDSENGREPPEYSESIDDAASIISSSSARVMTSANKTRSGSCGDGTYLWD
jgi:hypothetical protein